MGLDLQDQKIRREIWKIIESHKILYKETIRCTLMDSSQVPS